VSFWTRRQVQDLPSKLRLDEIRNIHTDHDRLQNVREDSSVALKTMMVL
jgi:hypothetical protein